MGTMREPGPEPNAKAAIRCGIARPPLVDSNFTKALPNLYRFIFSFGKVGAFKLVLRHFRECESVQCALASISDRFRTVFGPFSHRME